MTMRRIRRRAAIALGAAGTGIVLALAGTTDTTLDRATDPATLAGWLIGGAIVGLLVTLERGRRQGLFCVAGLALGALALALTRLAVRAAWPELTIPQDSITRAGMVALVCLALAVLAAPATQDRRAEARKSALYLAIVLTVGAVGGLLVGGQGLLLSGLCAPFLAVALISWHRLRDPKAAPLAAA